MIGPKWICGTALMVMMLVPLAAEEAARRTIHAGGDAEIRVAPDEVRLTLGVETFDPDLSRAKEDNDDRVAAILALAKKKGVQPQHLETDYLLIEPRYRYEAGRRTFVDYLVRRSVVITLRDVPTFESLLSGALEAGANYVHGVDFRTTELRKHRDKARQLAIEAAREKATAMAAHLGQKIGAPLSVSEGSAGWWSGYGSWWGSRWGSASQNVMQSVGSSSAGTGGPTSPGQISITAQVGVTFELVN